MIENKKNDTPPQKKETPEVKYIIKGALHFKLKQLLGTFNIADKIQLRNGNMPLGTIIVKDLYDELDKSEKLNVSENQKENK